ncbi:MAG: replication factor C small subunit [Candidatus Micrarchaeota archaeon]|nr:replication factor C small subunit [Candidatus Micrarchaeota archaeon]
MEFDLPWTEKYRPKTLDDVIGQAEIAERMKAYVKSRNIPHMLLAGPAGVGKTTTALALAHDLFKENTRQSFLELNASDERGIDVVRGRIKDFARTLPLTDVPFKIILLDEADALTPDAQHALRRTMEMFAGATRFILSCNYSSKLIEPIQSRCSVFRFKPLSEHDMKEMVKRIAKAEKIEVHDEAVKALIYISEGDMRKIINALQGAATSGKKIMVDRIGEYNFRMVEGANERIQLEALLAQIMLIGCEKSSG